MRRYLCREAGDDVQKQNGIRRCEFILEGPQYGRAAEGQMLLDPELDEQRQGDLCFD